MTKFLLALFAMSLATMDAYGMKRKSAEIEKKQLAPLVQKKQKLSKTLLIGINCLKKSSSMYLICCLLSKSQELDSSK